MKKKILNVLFHNDGATLGITIGLALVVLWFIYVEPRVQEWASERESIVQTVSVGKALRTEYQSSTLTKRSNVETTKGTFVVRGAFQMVRDNELVINELKSGSRFLCDEVTQSCNKLL